ncbi:MAG: NADPH-dependent 7-cyano-7-deazaguanine reductase QueF [Firmicutes bacterium]|nr:NADPH-dependent 7-cyano-7-deazaguanine reductase QueF [Bacillota bacterium]
MWSSKRREQLVKTEDFYALGKVVREPVRKLDVFPKPEGVTHVVMESDEVTSLCPVTGQPDWETVTIEYVPDKLCIESKSLKLYFWSFRQEGLFCEALAAKIANDVGEACKPHSCTVTVRQKPRGGITITATARYEKK